MRQVPAFEGLPRRALVHSVIRYVCKRLSEFLTTYLTGVSRQAESVRAIVYLFPQRRGRGSEKLPAPEAFSGEPVVEISFLWPQDQWRVSSTMRAKVL